MKCDICGSKVQEIFLKKVVGTFVRDSSGKRRLVCNACQSKLSDEDLLEHL